MATYCLVWASLVQDTGRSYSAILRRQEEQQELIRYETIHSRENEVNDDSKGRGTLEIYEPQYLRRRKQAKNRGGNQSGPIELFDWTFWALCFALSLLSYVRIRLEPSRRRRNSSSPEETAAIMQTLRRVNRDRAAQGQEAISMSSFLSLRQVLLQDQALLRGLAGRAGRSEPVARGATPQQLELCPQRVIPDHGEEGECAICLTSYQPKDVVRTLPCQHLYHTQCIDHWLQQSTLCPVCKVSV